jgi:hypothetical protein
MGQGRLPELPSELPADRETDVDIKFDPTEVYVRTPETPPLAVEAIEEEAIEEEDGDEPTQLMAPRSPLRR